MFFLRLIAESKAGVLRGEYEIKFSPSSPELVQDPDVVGKVELTEEEANALTKNRLLFELFFDNGGTGTLVVSVFYASLNEGKNGFEIHTVAARHVEILEA